jgi:hypothetical protein
MLESRERLGADIRSLLEILRELAEARYACLVEPARVLFESYEAEAGVEPLRSLLQGRLARLFELPAKMGTAEALEQDAFEGLEQDAFLLAVVNGRVALLLCCPDAQAAEEHIARPLQTLVDRLLRFEPAYRGPSGLFLGSPRVDVVRVERAAAGDGADDAEHP